MHVRCLIVGLNTHSIPFCSVLLTYWRKHLTSSFLRVDLPISSSCGSKVLLSNCYPVSLGFWCFHVKHGAIPVQCWRHVISFSSCSLNCFFFLTFVGFLLVYLSNMIPVVQKRHCVQLSSRH